MEGIAAADHGAERAAQGRQRRQRYIDYSLKGLRPRYLQRKAQEYLMENPNATWNNFSTRIIQRDMSFQVSSNFLNDEEQTKAHMATLRQEMKNLRSELQEHRVNAVEGTTRPVDPNQKGRQNATRFCNYCRTNGHTPSWCRKKIRDEELKRIESERTAEKRVTFTQSTTRNEDHTMDRNNGPQVRISKEETTTIITTGSGEMPPIIIRISLQDQTSHMRTITRTTEDQITNAQISHSKDITEIDTERDLSTTRRETGETMVIFLVLHPLKGETSHKTIPLANQEVISLTTLLSADLTIDLRRVLRPTKKSYRKTIIKHHLMWFASPQPMIPLTNCRIFAR